MTYRIYADGTVVHEDDFEEWDNAQPYYDDYSVHTVPDETDDVDYWDIPEELRKYIKEFNHA